MTRRARPAALAWLYVLLLVAWLAWGQLVAPGVIARAYGGDGLALLQRLLQAHGPRPLADYLEFWRRSVWTLAGLWIGGGFGWWAITRPRFQRCWDATRGVAPDVRQGLEDSGRDPDLGGRVVRRNPEHPVAGEGVTPNAAATACPSTAGWRHAGPPGPSAPAERGVHLAAPPRLGAHGVDVQRLRIRQAPHVGSRLGDLDHVARLLVEHQYGVYPPPVTTWGLDIAASPWLHHGLAAATLGLELAFPLALFSPRARCLLLPAAYLMHVGIRVLLGSNFLGLILVYAFWVPWERLAATLGAARRPAEGPACA